MSDSRYTVGRTQYSPGEASRIGDVTLWPNGFCLACWMRRGVEASCAYTHCTTPTAAQSTHATASACEPNGHGTHGRNTTRLSARGRERDRKWLNFGYLRGLPTTKTAGTRTTDECKCDRLAPQPAAGLGQPALQGHAGQQDHHAGHESRPHDEVSVPRVLGEETTREVKGERNK